MSTIPLNLETDTVVLPAPALSPTATLAQALENRRSSRAFLPDTLPLETLSALLWAGFGINRRDNAHRTAPSARNWQEIQVFAVLPEGAYASAGLGTVVRGLIDRGRLAAALGLAKTERVALAQSVGYPAPG